MKPLQDGTVLFHNVSKRYRLGSLGTMRETISSLTSKKQEDDPSRILWALKDISFRVEPGESLGLIGPNGAGKTTALKLLSNITRQTEGTISVNGRVSSLIELGAGFHPELTGRENIFLNGAILGLSRREIGDKLDKIIAFAELERFIDTPVKRYSSGMYVRLGFAVAAHVEPQILLVDEVLAVGDANFRQKCIARMDELRSLGTTLLFVSHNMHMVRRLCEDAVLLMAGKLRYYGAIDDAIAKYEYLMHEPSVATELDLPSAVDRGVLISEITILDSKGEESSLFQHGEPLVVEVRFSTAHVMHAPVIRSRIISDDNTVVAMVATHHKRSGEKLDFSLSGSDRFYLNLHSLELVGGCYSVEVRIMDTTDTSTIAAGHSNTFCVESPGFAYESDRGRYLPTVSWDFPEQD